MLYEQTTPNNRYYTAYGVLKMFLEDHSYQITNFDTIHQAVDRVIMWTMNGTGHIDGVENSDQITHFVCVKLAPTQFQIWGYFGNYEQAYMTSFDYADVNTPRDLATKRPDYTR